MSSDEIIIVEYDPEWPSKFQEEEVRIREAFGGILITLEHIGSTSVPGLCAKPVIDILVGLRDLGGVREYFPKLAEIGYINIPGDDDKVRLFFRKGSPRTHHLHIVVHQGGEWDRHIAFRDALRTDPELRTKYATLKRRSAMLHRNDRQAYVNSKNDLVEEALQRIGYNPK